MKHSWTNSFNLSFSFELGIVVYIEREKSNVFKLLKGECESDVDSKELYKDLLEYI
jgi:hypothetical protein